MNKKKSPILFIMILILSCTKELKESERYWNPYTMNEVLVFESSEKQLDTLIINKIEDVTSSGPTPELYRYKSLGVYAEKLNSKNKLFSTTMILDISTSTPTPKKPARIGFELYFGNANYGSSHKLKDLDKYPVISVTTKAGTFNDVIKLKPEIHYSKRKNEVKFMYWSKKDGYIKFERADGFTWELVKKYVP